jgi:ankyrin repeat protein
MAVGHVLFLQGKKSHHHQAATNGHKDVAELLLLHKADVNSVNQDKDLPLHWAAHNGH